MINLSDRLYAEIKSVIQEWTEPGIYAISFFVSDYDDDPQFPTVTVGYNTHKQYESSMQDASDLQEAKWNYAFWLQNEEYCFGYDDTGELVQNWIAENHFENIEASEEEQYDENGRYIGNGPLITQKFIEQLVITACRLHAENIIKDHFGKDLPVIIHELECYEAIARQTQEANPNGEADEFVRWIREYN